MNDRDAILEAIRSFVSSFAARDLAGLLAYYDDDLVKVRQGAPAESRTETARRVQEMFDRFRTRVDVDNEELEVSGDLAFTRGTFIVTLEPVEGGPSRQIVRRYLEIWRKTGGRWRVARTMDNTAQA